MKFWEINMFGHTIAIQANGGFIAYPQKNHFKNDLLLLDYINS